MHVNLVILSAASLADVDMLPLTYSLIGMVFAIMLGIILYNFHTSYTAKSAKWMKIKEKQLTIIRDVKALIVGKKDTTTPDAPAAAAAAAAATSSHDPHKIITHSVIELREVLLED
jgi:hypothetical protein